MHDDRTGHTGRAANVRVNDGSTVTRVTLRLRRLLLRWLVSVWFSFKLSQWGSFQSRLPLCLIWSRPFLDGYRIGSGDVHGGWSGLASWGGGAGDVSPARQRTVKVGSLGGDNALREVKRGPPKQGEAGCD